MVRSSHKLTRSPAAKYAPLVSLCFLISVLSFSSAREQPHLAQPTPSAAQLAENRSAGAALASKQLVIAPLPPPPPPPQYLLNHLVKLNSNNSRSLASYKQYQLAHGQHLARRPEAPKRRANLFERVCTGTSNRMLCPHNKTDHYLNTLERYKNCTYVIGNLELTCLERDADLSFLDSIREITGHLLIAHVELEHISMANLQIIRGSDLFSLPEQSGEFAMILVQNELKTLQLPNLREILAGSVGSYNNSNLCYLRNNINWDEILNWPKYRSVFVYEGQVPECPPCDLNCPGGCWAEGADMCQKLSKTNCAHQCTNRCFGPTEFECCDHSCAGGCLGPKSDQCLACKGFYDDGRCINECPAQKIYNPVKFQWELNPNGKYAFGAACVKDCPENLMRDSGACVRTCPPNKRHVNGECQPCSGPCPKNCQGVEVVHSGNIDQLINCTVIEGSITILDSSFQGHTELDPTNGSVITRSKPMHPSRLEVFKTVREINDYLNIRANHADFTSLSYLRNLKVIGARQVTDPMNALSIVGTSLKSLNLRSLRRIKGKILIEENKDLCFADTIDWKQLNVVDRDISTRNNADNVRCRKLALQCHEQCARDGCWGPGPDECLSCNNYKLDDFCVVNCTAAPYLAYDAGSRTCKKCHPECRLGCRGSDASQCLQCKSVKDGPYCVNECPDFKYNRNGTCEPCAKGCRAGCTGPSSYLGEGGCNQCGKPLVNSTGDSFVVQCLHAEEPCPDGFYQEYVPAHQEGPLKLFSGKSICRRCHHRCKSCTGMGTHVSVCECANYVAGEQCEDSCPRDHFADIQSRKCIRCSPECNGCTGPTEADCVSCRIYRVYYELPSASNSNSQLPTSAQLLSAAATSAQQAIQVRFNCTAQCPTDKPHRISESNMLDPYCSEDPGIDSEIPRMAASSSTSILFILIISSSIMVCISLYRCQIEKDKTVKLTMHLSGIDDVEPLTPSNLKPNLAPLRSIKETELRKGNVLGSGFGGTVYQGFWFPEGKLGKTDGTKSSAIPVAIKVLRDNGQSNVNKEFLDEAYTMASVNHPNLVRLLAVCMTPSQLMLVTQLMPLGCLLEYVKKYKNDVGSKNLLEWCKQIARGMSYLEDRRMVHRDLALRNVLLQTSGKALISDFGLAKFLDVDQNEYHSGGGRLPIKWLAPECIRERKFTHKSDVWAFGVTIWELLTFGKRPFENCDTKDLLSYIESGKRLEQPAYMSTEVYLIMFSCWFFRPDDRPNFRQLVQDFVRFARDPQRYLICNTKGIDYCDGKLKGLDEDAAEYTCDEYESDLASDDQDGTDEFDQSPPTTATTTIMPELTPSTHNRLNEMFGFELRRHGGPESNQDDRTVVINASDLDQEHHLHHHRVLQQHHLRSQQHNFHLQQIMDDEHEDRYTKVEDGVDGGAYVNAGSNCKLVDINNNNTWATGSSGHNMTSEQPTDTYDYLLPSPCTDTGKHNQQIPVFMSRPDLATDQVGCHLGQSQFSPLSGNQQDSTFRVQNPPHSAGPFGSAINNDEYFLNRPNYVNQHLFMRSETDLSKPTLVESELKQVDVGQQRSQRKSKKSKPSKSRQPVSRSNSNIPHSLV